MTTNSPIAGAKITLFSKNKNTDHKTVDSIIAWESKYEIVAATISDSIGKFNFTHVTAQEYAITCFFKMPMPGSSLSQEILDKLGRYDHLENLSVKYGQTYNHTFHLMVTCPYDKTKKQSYCPKCLQTDMVQQISWGLHVADIDDNNIQKGKNVREYYFGGGEMDSWCHATKHCKRCCINF